MENVTWKNVKIYGYDHKRMISYLETLDNEYIDNLIQCTAEKGYCCFIWSDENKKHILDNEGIKIPYCKEWPNGDYWGNDSKFRILKKRQYLVTDSKKVHEAIKFDILLEQLKGQSLMNAIDYLCIANNLSTDWSFYLKDEIQQIEHKNINDKIAELNNLLTK